MIGDLDAAGVHLRSIGHPEAGENDSIGRRSENAEGDKSDLERQQVTGLRGGRTPFRQRRRSFIAVTRLRHVDRRRSFVRPNRDGRHCKSCAQPRTEYTF